MKTKEQSPQQVPDITPFDPSPLPTEAEHAALAARLLAGKLPLKDEDIRGAVDAAARIWGAVLSHETERTIEETRLTFCPDRDRKGAEDRWNQWRYHKCGTEESIRNYEIAAMKRKENGDTKFEGLSFPAAYDDVLRRIMNGALGDGAENSRHEEFSEAWIQWVLPDRERNELGGLPGMNRPPNQVEVLKREFQRREALCQAGEDPGPWPFDGAEGAKRLQTALSELLAQEKADAGIARANAGFRIRELAESQRSETVSESTAHHWLEQWKNQNTSEKRRSAGKKGGGSRKPQIMPDA